MSGGSSIVAVALILNVGYTSIHLLHALITTRNKWPINGQAWFMCKWDQGLSGHLKDEEEQWMVLSYEAGKLHTAGPLILPSNPGHHK